MTRRIILLGIFCQAFFASASRHVEHYTVFESLASGLDGPKVQPINATTFDWWYFDVVSTNPADLSTAVVTFFSTPPSAFPFLTPSNDITVAVLWISYPNGSLWSTASYADGATVKVDGDYTSGIWNNSGFSWASTESGYLIEIDAPDAGVTGTISFKTVAPPHYPCGPAEAGQNLELGPHIGWANAISDADSTVDLHIDGNTRFAFKGTGYHDKNWSDVTFGTHIASWYWGRGRLGPYSLVWWDVLSRTGAETFSAYAAKDNKILAASCAPGSIKVRPIGQNSTYPPVLSTGNPSGYRVELDLGPDGKLELDLTVLAPLIALNPEYARFVGNMSGSITCGKHTEKLTGMALFEQFKLTE
ncbi:hypothetical protein C8F04DRAFT_1291807 [Mycena alexandri]|uniref:Hydroxyneurosporene synthase n=1 Tax=Mycena alexandri TaxID=1745969 RepID=A0AAD6SJP4_9AGAR|nr:hypothetical protein C8F04DRAFT_1291807 [Mycena alexandri]